MQLNAKSYQAPKSSAVQQIQMQSQQSKKSDQYVFYQRLNQTQSSIESFLNSRKQIAQLSPKYHATTSQIYQQTIKRLDVKLKPQVFSDVELSKLTSKVPLQLTRNSQVTSTSQLPVDDQYPRRMFYSQRVLNDAQKNYQQKDVEPVPRSSEHTHKSPLLSDNSRLMNQLEEEKLRNIAFERSNLNKARILTQNEQQFVRLQQLEQAKLKERIFEERFAPDFQTMPNFKLYKYVSGQCPTNELRLIKPFDLQEHLKRAEIEAEKERRMIDELDQQRRKTEEKIQKQEEQKIIRREQLAKSSSKLFGFRQGSFTQSQQFQAVKVAERNQKAVAQIPDSGSVDNVQQLHKLAVVESRPQQQASAEKRKQEDEEPAKNAVPAIKQDLSDKIATREEENLVFHQDQIAVDAKVDTYVDAQFDGEPESKPETQMKPDLQQNEIQFQTELQKSKAEAISETVGNCLEKTVDQAQDEYYEDKFEEQTEVPEKQKGVIVKQEAAEEEFENEKEAESNGKSQFAEENGRVLNNASEPDPKLSEDIIETEALQNKQISQSVEPNDMEELAVPQNISEDNNAGELGQDFAKNKNDIVNITQKEGKLQSNEIQQFNEEVKVEVAQQSDIQRNESKNQQKEFYVAEEHVKATELADCVYQRPEAKQLNKNMADFSEFDEDADEEVLDLNGYLEQKSQRKVSGASNEEEDFDE